MVAALAVPPGAETNALGAIIELTLSRVVARDLRRPPSLRQALPMTDAVDTLRAEESPDRETAVAPVARETGALPIVSRSDLPTEDQARVQATDQVRHDEDASDAVQPSAPGGDSAASQALPRRRVAVPATLNPVVAEALLSLLSPPEGGVSVSGVEVSGEGIYVPLVVWERLGLDTGLVVRALHDARLLVLQGARKVWRKRHADEDVAGLMLNRSLLA